MQVQHPLAGDGDGVAPSNVDVDGETVPVNEEGVFELPDRREGWLRRFADAYDADPDDLVHSADADAESESAEAEVEPPFDPSEFNVDELEERLADSDLTDEELDALAAVEDRKTGLDAIDAARED